jgi:hypothetical protein
MCVEKTAQCGALRSVLAKYYPGDQIKKIKMDGACGTYGREERSMQGFGRER